jgi:hypothetical protein
MENIVNALVEEDSDLSALEEHETRIAQAAMELVLTAVEKCALLGLVAGRLRPYKRDNGRIAIWGKLPERRWKFYCIGTVRKFKLTSRVAEIQLAEGCNYMVSPNSFEMP